MVPRSPVVKPDRSLDRPEVVSAELLPPEAGKTASCPEQFHRQGTGRIFFLLGGLAGLGVGLLWWWDPAVWSLPVCSFYWLTGLYCPGCGGLRAAHAMLHGRLAEAWAYHPLLVLLTPWAAYGVLRWAISSVWPHRRWPGRWLYGPWAFLILAGIALLFGLLRNLPWEPFCHWTPGP